MGSDGQMSSGSIDYDHYRRAARALRREAKTQMAWSLVRMVRRFVSVLGIATGRRRAVVLPLRVRMARHGS
jgi:hypothetical protein